MISPKIDTSPKTFHCQCDKMAWEIGKECCENIQDHKTHDIRLNYTPNLLHVQCLKAERWHIWKMSEEGHMGVKGATHPRPRKLHLKCLCSESVISLGTF